MKYLNTTLIIIALTCTMQSFAYTPLRIESREEQLERQIREAELKKQLEDAKRGVFHSDKTKQSSLPRSTFETEIHSCRKDGYHNTSYENFCFDMYFYSTGSVYWNRRRWNRNIYNDQLSGTYHLEKVRTNYYKLYIRWNNGQEMTGKVEYKNNRPEIHLGKYVFTGK